MANKGKNQRKNHRLLQFRKKCTELSKLIKEREDAMRKIEGIQFDLREYFDLRAQAEKPTLENEDLFKTPLQRFLLEVRKRDVQIESVNWKDNQNEEVLINEDSKKSFASLISQLVKLSDELTHHAKIWKRLTKGVSRSGINALCYRATNTEVPLCLFERIISDSIFLDLVERFRTYSSITYKSSSEDVLTEQMQNELRTKVPNASVYDMEDALASYLVTLKLLRRAELTYNFRMFLFYSNFKMEDNLDTVKKHDEFNRQNFGELLPSMLESAVDDYKCWLMNPASHEAKLFVYENMAKYEWEQQKAKENEDLFKTPLQRFLLQARKRNLQSESVNWKDYQDEKLLLNACLKMSFDLLLLQLVKLSNSLTQQTTIWNELTVGDKWSGIVAGCERVRRKIANYPLFKSAKSDSIFLDLVDLFGTYSTITYKSSSEDLLTEQMQKELRTKVPDASVFEMEDALKSYLGTLKSLWLAQLEYNFRMFLLYSNFKVEDDLDTIEKHDEFNRQNFDELLPSMLGVAIEDYKYWLMNFASHEAKLLVYEKAAKYEWEQQKAKANKDLFKTPLQRFLLEARKRGYVFNPVVYAPEDEVSRMMKYCLDVRRPDARSDFD